MQLKPLGDNIVVKAISREETTKSGIILPETVNKESRQEGKLVAIGSGEKVGQLKLSTGQKVVFSEYGGSDVKIDGQEYKILNHDDLLAVIE